MGEAQATRVDDAGEAAVYVVAYLEVMPPSTAEAAALLKQYREASRTDAGYVDLEVLQQRNRPGYFAILEVWQDRQAFDAHALTEHARQFHETLQPLRVSPYDERLHNALVKSATRAARADGATYVLTHADAVPPAKDDAVALLQLLAEASRIDDGVLRFEVLQQCSRQNHFTLVELWRNQQALDAHTMAAHTKNFRERFQPLTGSLYDARLYQALD
jgi:quinol monooxygenase YgiN